MWSEDFIRRFWARVLKTETCWLWTKGVTKATAASKAPYGCVSYRGHRYRAHRVVYELTYGPILPEIKVLHHCDTPLCVRPDHLFPGTAYDNVHDAMRKNRRNYEHAQGERNPRATMTRAKVEEMRRLYADGMNTTALARQFNTTRGNAWLIVTHRNWK